MMNRFESLLKSNFFPRRPPARPRSLYVRTLMKFMDTGSDAMSSVHKKARLGFAARSSINQSAPPVDMIRLNSQRPCSYYYHHRHYYYCDIIHRCQRVMDVARVWENASACADRSHSNYLRVIPNPLSTTAPRSPRK